MNDYRKIEEGNLTLEFTPDNSRAFLTVNSLGDEYVPDKDYLRRFLQKHNLGSDFSFEAVDLIIKDRVAGKRVCVAKGRRALPSKDGWLEYLFDKKSEGGEDYPNPVNHRERGIIKAAGKGEAIVRLHPPVQGEDGVTVFGEVIPAGTGGAVKMPQGKNTVIDPDDSSLLLAAENGAVLVVSSEKIDIVPLLEINGNVDYSVGNIDFTGSLIIKGDVLSGFTVRATGSVDVLGVIEDAEVYAGKNVRARACVGRNKGIIRAGGAVYVLFAENSSIEAGQDVIASDYLMNCRVHADRQVVVKEKKGLIAGGQIISGSTVEAKIIGTRDELQTVVSAGFPSELRQQLLIIDEEQTRNIKNLGMINRAILKLNRLVMIRGQSSDLTKARIKELLRMKNIIEESIATVLERQEEVITRFSNSDNASITVYDTLYGGVKINFPDYQKSNRTIHKNIRLIQKGEGIQIYPAR